MKFETLKERMEYYKELTNYKLMPNSYVICHIDGRSFSKKIKKLFRLPFDERFMNMMDESAAFACQNVQGCKFAYVQSDEITLILTDFDRDGTDVGSAFFSYRLCKMQSIISGLVTCRFQQLFSKLMIENLTSTDNEDVSYLINKRNLDEVFSEKNTFQFDCKCWVVPEYNDVFAWIKYRQNDCIRNSKQQAAQTYCSQRELVRKSSDEQVNYLMDKTGICWDKDYTNEEKYGRIIKRVVATFKDGNGEEYTRHKWVSEGFQPITRELFDNMNILPKRDA